MHLQPGADTLAVHFEQLDSRDTPIGTLSLRRRRLPALDQDIYEIKLGEEFLMSSLFTTGEIALARLGLAAVTGEQLDVLVGGLGLGYTADAALAHPNVRALWIIDALPEVIDWHRRGLLPLGQRLTADSRCHLVHGDFFEIATDDGFAVTEPERFHAILVDIDHSPRHLLHPRHDTLYVPAGLERIVRRLHPRGVFALWSNDPPDDEFMRDLNAVFTGVEAHVVEFQHPLQDRVERNTIYVAMSRG